MDNFLGKRLDGRYEILELIGVGGMANVYKAYDRLEDSIVAVKILREEFLTNEEFVRRFKNESKAISMLSHPNIVKVYDVNFSDNIQCIVMEYIDGITLKEYIERQKKLTWKDAVHFTTQVLKALQHAHSRGIVHRDIKPQNIMLLPDGSIKVMDFGIARFSRSETRTITDKAIGSVHYISPEQAKGDVTDAKADIYSTGVMLYEMLTGRLPFESDSPVSVAIKQISDQPTGLREIDPNIPEGLEEITFKAMAKNPSDRYQSAQRMLDDIEEFKKNPSIKFEYKYFSDNAPTKYIDTIEQVKGTSGNSGSVRRSNGGKKGGGFSIWLMMGITLACVIGAGVLIYMVFNLGGNSLFAQKVDVDLPNFVGENVNDVVNSGSDFKFTVIEDYNINYDVGVIYSQSPVDGKQIKEDGEVTLYVSKGTEIIQIPPVVGLSNGEAVTMLQDMGLVVMLETTSDETQGDNKVVKTEPAQGEEVKTGTVVIVYINSLTSTTTTYVPKLVGLTYSEAKTTLAVNGLVLGDITEGESETYDKGIIIGQSKVEGALVNQGERIDIVLSTGKPKKTYTVTVKLPRSVNGSTTYNVSATLEGGQVGSPVTVSSGPVDWSITTEGTTPGVLNIYCANVLMYSFQINYAEQTQTLLVSNYVDDYVAPADKSGLNSRIATANDYLNNTYAEGTAGLVSGQYVAKQAEIDALKNTRDAANGVSANPSASQSDIDAASSALQVAIDKFAGERKPLP